MSTARTPGIFDRLNDTTLHQIGDELLRLIAPPPIVLAVTKPPNQYEKVTVEARAEADDRLLHQDRLNVADATQRARFAKAVAKAAPELAEADAIDQRLMELDIPDPAEMRRSARHLLAEEDLDPDAVIRPGGFIAPTLAGQLVPRPVRGFDMNGLPIATVRYEFMLCHMDGSRERIPFQTTLSDQSGRVFYASSRPPVISPRTLRSHWTRTGQTDWLNGYTPSIEQVRDQLAAVIQSRVWLPQEVEEPLSLLLACYIVLTYGADALDVVPYLHVTGPKGSGKTQGVLVLLIDLAFMPVAAADVSAPVIFRLLDAFGGTLVLDETEKLSGTSERSQDVTNILNAGHVKGFPARRCEVTNGNIIVREFDCFSPKVLASIAPLPDALASRCIPFPMLRRPKKVKMPACNVDAAGLRDDLHALTLTHALELRSLLRSPDDTGLQNRAGDLWRPLLKIAGWLDPDGSENLAELLRAYAEAAVVTAEEESGVPDTDEALLLALHARVRTGTHVTTQAQDLLTDVRSTHLHLFEHWTPKRISTTLSRYSLRTKKRRCGKEIKKTYGDVTLDRLNAVMETYGIDVPTGDDAKGSSA